MNEENQLNSNPPSPTANEQNLQLTNLMSSPAHIENVSILENLDDSALMDSHQQSIRQGATSAAPSLLLEVGERSALTQPEPETWHGYRKDSSEPKDIMFKVERTMNTFNKVEFEVLLNNANSDDPKKSIFKMRGSPFYRSCTIYNGETIVAHTSLMYKHGIRNVIVPRNKFRLTIFPGYADHDFIFALAVIFFYGRKLWI
ncbi:protein LURP-one-related 7-like [Rutidosis leptorrhynchoides]|uniref:protein LURP-one-related 7-like n=1 Tax=Rutidosis leptorrhynchoides TaxID=125765 RepID=UPI003A99CE16